MDLPFVKYTFPALAMFLSLFISEKEQRSMLMINIYGYAKMSELYNKIHGYLEVNKLFLT